MSARTESVIEGSSANRAATCAACRARGLFGVSKSARVGILVVGPVGGGTTRPESGVAVESTIVPESARAGGFGTGTPGGWTAPEPELGPISLDPAYAIAATAMPEPTIAAVRQRLGGRTI